MLISDLKKLLMDEYGDVELEPLSGGGTNYLYRLQGTVPQVVKISAFDPAGLMNEYRILKYLQDSEVTIKPNKVLKINNQVIIWMDYIPGQNLLQYLLELNKSDWKLSLPYYMKLGELLALNIHKYKFVESEYVRQSVLKDLSEQDFMSLDYVPKHIIEESFSLVSSIRSSEDLVLSHGDYGAHNVILESDSLKVIDWEFGEWNHPLSDIAWVCWYTHLHFPETAEERCYQFLMGYIKYSSIEFSPDKLRAYCIYKIWRILLYAVNLSDSVKKEWVRRIEWTLNHDFLSKIQNN